jgi:hypothetical protein
VAWAMANHLAILYAGSHADAAHLPRGQRRAGGPRVVSSSTTARHPSAAWILPGDVDMVGGKPHVRRQPPRIARSAKRFVDHRPEDVALTPS